MVKEYDSDRITPENAESEIHSYLEGVRVGSVEYIAFNDALRWRQSYFRLKEYRRVLEILDSGEELPKQVKQEYGSRNQIMSALRVAEVSRALTDFEGNRNGSTIPGYTAAYTYCHELIADYEENIMQISKFDKGDPVLSELRGRAEAHDFASERISEIERGNQNAGAHWLIGLIGGLR